MKSRLGIKRAKSQLELAAGRIDQAVYFAAFDLRYLDKDADAKDHAFHKALVAAQEAIRAAREAAK